MAGTHTYMAGLDMAWTLEKLQEGMAFLHLCVGWAGQTGMHFDRLGGGTAGRQADRQVASFFHSAFSTRHLLLSASAPFPHCYLPHISLLWRLETGFIPYKWCVALTCCLCLSLCV